MTWTWLQAAVGLPLVAISVLLGAPITTTVLTRASRRPHDERHRTSRTHESPPGADGATSEARSKTESRSDEAPDVDARPTGFDADTGARPRVATGAGATAPAGARPAADHGPTGRAATDALRGGTWIGYLERLAITASIIAGAPSAIAVVVAIKGLGRYPELKDNPAASERFVIGTLASFLWGAVCGVAGLVLVQVL